MEPAWLHNSDMSLFSRTVDLPGLRGTLRECTRRGKGLKRLSAGDIAVIDAPDINRAFAQRLIDANPVAVINVAEFTTGAVPNFGPQMMLDAGITLVDGVGAEVWRHLKDGRKGVLTDDGELYQGDTLICAGRVLSPPEAEKAFTEAQGSLVDHMEAFFGNTIQFIHSEAPLLIDGLGVPETGVEIANRKVLVLSPGPDHREQLKRLQNFIREYDPVLIGVDSAADALVDAKYTPDLVVGDPSGIGSEALRSGARVVLPADPDGHAVGLERIQDLGIGAMTFPAASKSATDLALLLADYHGASLIVNAGSPLDLHTIFVGGPEATPSALLTRAKLGSRLIDGDTVEELYNVGGRVNLAWLWTLLGFLVAVAVVLVIAGTSGDGGFTENLIDTWNNLALTVQSWFR